MYTETETLLFWQVRDAIVALASHEPGEQCKALAQLIEYTRVQGNVSERQAIDRLLNALLYATR